MKALPINPSSDWGATTINGIYSNSPKGSILKSSCLTSFRLNNLAHIVDDIFVCDIRPTWVSSFNFIFVLYCSIFYNHYCQCIVLSSSIVIPFIVLHLLPYTKIFHYIFHHLRSSNCFGTFISVKLTFWINMDSTLRKPNGATWNNNSRVKLMWRQSASVLHWCLYTCMLKYMMTVSKIVIFQKYQQTIDLYYFNYLT